MGRGSAAPVGLGTATSFAVLAGQAVTNTGLTEVSGDVGVSPGTTVVGFPPGEVTNGTIHVSDAVADQAHVDLITAYDDAAARPATASTSELGGQTLAPGVYNATSGMSIIGTVTLDGQNDPDSVFIFQAGSTLITASDSTVVLIRGASVCNVFWQVGSSATFGTNSTFVGTVMALTSATVQTKATVQGRVLARNAQVSLDDNTIIRPSCAATTTTTATTSTSTPTTTQPGSNGGGSNGDGGSGGSGSNGSGGGSGNGSGGNGSGGGGGGNGSGSTTATTRPGMVLIPPTVEPRPPPGAPDDNSSLPPTM